ncbi:MAG: hypothetical protein NVSMB52_07310 [Chloroflexota bacterium]
MCWLVREDAVYDDFEWPWPKRGENSIQYHGESGREKLQPEGT